MLYLNLIKQRQNMKTVYLFDWGDTLMRDFPDEKGAMCNWNKVEMMPNADKMLRELSQIADCYLATNAKDSTKGEIFKALERVRLDVYIKDIFCFQELGVSKPSSEYFDIILKRLIKRKEDLLMIGDNIETDVQGVKKLGIDAILYDPKCQHNDYNGKKINDLMNLIAIVK